VVDKMELGQVFSEYFGFPCQSSFHQLLHNHPHLSSGAVQRSEVAAVPGDVSPTPLKKKSRNSVPPFPVTKSDNDVALHVSERSPSVGVYDKVSQ
jgi:hypothetical protein